MFSFACLLFNNFTEQKASFDALTLDSAYVEAECYTNPTGTDYYGYVSQTEDNFVCQRWDVNYPNKRNDAKKSKPRHNKLVFGSHNYCRNDGTGPDGATNRPWCWIADPVAIDAGNRWGYCDTEKYLSASCPNKGNPVGQDRVGIFPECMTTALGIDYAGSVNVTETGLPCMDWADLNEANKYNAAFSDQGNKCRTLSDSDQWGRPWCFVTTSLSEKCRVKDHYDQCFPAVAA
ncbi:plasminogen-like [Lytechinus variegatus]|uniref:plasminogen-like n=1 Tax=Lytechinus variegatus TaxID=7654 RepID=UPI001BB22E93|nr:plasminogen-like [Lytechinus variegatus]